MNLKNIFKRKPKYLGKEFLPFADKFMASLDKIGKPENKPNCKCTMYITFRDKDPIKMHTYIIDLADIELAAINEEYVLTIFSTADKIKENHEGSILVAISDDPSMMQAGDWTNLGHSRLIFVLDNARFEKSNNSIVFIGKKFDISFIMPERIFPDADEKYKKVELI